MGVEAAIADTELRFVGKPGIETQPSSGLGFLISVSAERSKIIEIIGQIDLPIRALDLDLRVVAEQLVSLPDG